MTMKRIAGAGLAMMILLGMMVALGAVDSSAQGQDERSSSPPNHIQNCTVELINEASVSTMVPGVIQSFAVSEGATITKDAPLAQLDAQESQIDHQLALDELNVAKQQAENDIDKRVATEAYGVAYEEWQSAIAVNKQSSGAISPTEVSKLHFEAKRAHLAIEQAGRDFEIAKVTVHARETQVRAAELAVARRQIKAPIGGIVQEKLLHEGEWVNPGDVLLRIVQLDQLKVLGFVDSRDLHPSEVKNKNVSVEVILARGRRVQFTGRIDFVSTQIEDDDHYRVSATVVNREENGHWVLSPGMIAAMTIDVGTLQAVERPTTSGSTR